ncbi:MAG: TetR/AcrR family transcriptional regulator [Clostridia bacterium]|nr:TetR/AcrR family transcriptional regulator [Clostridia bacterium]
MQVLKEEVRERILDASAKIFVQKGIEKTTIRDIAKEADTSTGNIYRYFDSKDKIISKLMNQLENSFRSFDKVVDLDVFDSKKGKKIDEFIDGITDLLEKQYLEMKLVCMSNCDQVNEMKSIIIGAITKRIQYKLKNKSDKNLARTIAASTLEGIRIIIGESKIFSENVRKDLKQYLRFELTNIIPRIEGV